MSTNWATKNLWKSLSKLGKAFKTTLRKTRMILADFLSSVASMGNHSMEPVPQARMLAIGGMFVPRCALVKHVANYLRGYCNRGNVLFPTWHRAYLWRLENALRTVEGCEDVTLPFWDEFSYYNGPGKEGPKQAIPEILTHEFWPPDQQVTRNPLRSYRFPRKLVDADDNKKVYDKHKGYETVRFPLSGLVGTEEAQETSKAYNNNIKGDPVDILNQNVSAWLNLGIEIPPTGQTHPDTYSVGARYQICLNAPNYMVFSKKSSATQFMTDHDIEAKDHLVVSLEDPHNAIHLSLGGINQ